MGIPTGQGKTWNASRVGSPRAVYGIRAYRSTEKNGEWLTMSEAAADLSLIVHLIFKPLEIKDLAFHSLE